MTEAQTILLRDLHNGGFVEAQLYERIDASFAQRADDAWIPYLAVAKAQAAGAQLPAPAVEHGHWRWKQKVSVTSHLLSYPTLGIEYEGDVQGLMMLLTDGEFGRLGTQQSQPLVYVHFLATAPWNLPSVVAQPRFRGVGLTFMRAAVQTSFDLGFKGRVGLHSLPQSEDWYARLGMTCLGADPEKQGLRYFEMPAAQAGIFAPQGD